MSASACFALRKLSKTCSRTFSPYNFDLLTSAVRCVHPTGQDVEEPGEDEFTTPSFTKKPARQDFQRKRSEIERKPPRTEKMPIDQDWTAVWPTAASFKPSVVPLPLRMGLNTKGAPPDKWGNAELMKIPNFLHLTPLHIKKHCSALRQFCTEWPKGLETESFVTKHFPVKIIFSTYCHSGPTIRDPRSRIVTLKVMLSSLELDYHARDKLLRLVSDRYDPVSDTLTLVADRCPTRKQNLDYLHYLLTALYHESWKLEPWENEKTEADMEKYFWDVSQSKSSVISLVQHLEGTEGYIPSEEEVLAKPEVQDYSEAVTNLHNEGENSYTLSKYKESVLKILKLQS